MRQKYLGDRMSYMKRHGEERPKMPRVGKGKEVTSLFQTASVLKGKFYFNKTIEFLLLLLFVLRII
jgi:hypothetical protein